MKNKRSFCRRDFLKKAPLALAGTAAFPTIIKASALGLEGAVPPSDRIVMAGIGYGMQGGGNMRSFLGKSEVQWVAVCDLDDNHLRGAQNIVNENYGNKDCVVYKDYRRLFARGDLDAVSIAVPDHWHAILSINAVRTGLDVYGEKPFTHSLREGRALCNAIKRYGRVWQTGSWQRSEDNFHHACELVRNGRIGIEQGSDVLAIAGRGRHLDQALQQGNPGLGSHTTQNSQRLAVSIQGCSSRGRRCLIRQNKHEAGVAPVLFTSRDARPS